MPQRAPKTPFEHAFVKFMQWRGYESHSPEEIMELIDLVAPTAIRIYQDFKAGWDAAVAADASEDTASKARAFDILVKHVAAAIPPEVAIKQMSGIPLAEALTGFVFVSKEALEKMNERQA